VFYPKCFPEAKGMTQRTLPTKKETSPERKEKKKKKTEEEILTEHRKREGTPGNERSTVELHLQHAGDECPDAIKRHLAQAEYCGKIEKTPTTTVVVGR